MIRAAVACLALLISNAGCAAHRPTAEGADASAARGFGLDIGQVWPTTTEPAHSYGIRAELGTVHGGIRLVPATRYWRSTLRSGELERFADSLRRQGASVSSSDIGPIAWTNVSVGVDGHRGRAVPLGGFAYIGGGVALHLLHGTGPAVDDTFVGDLLGTVTGSVAGLVGLELDLPGPVRLFGEARYTVAGHVRYPGVRVGAALTWRAD